MMQFRSLGTFIAKCGDGRGSAYLRKFSFDFQKQ